MQEDFHRYIAEHEVDFIRFKTQLLLNEVGDDPIKRAGLISNVVESIALIPNSITRSVYIQDCSRMLNIQEQVLIAEINKKRVKHLERKKEQSDKEKERSEKQSQPAPIFGTSQVSPHVISENPFDKYELEILRMVRYGNAPIYRSLRNKKESRKGVIEGCAGGRVWV